MSFNDFISVSTNKQDDNELKIFNKNDIHSVHFYVTSVKYGLYNIEKHHCIEITFKNNEYPIYTKCIHHTQKFIIKDSSNINQLFESLNN